MKKISNVGGGFINNSRNFNKKTTVYNPTIISFGVIFLTTICFYTNCWMGREIIPYDMMNSTTSNKIMNVVLILFSSCMRWSSTSTTTTGYFVSAFAPSIMSVVSSSSNIKNNIFQKTFMNRQRRMTTKINTNIDSSIDEDVLAERIYEPKTKAAFDTYLHNYRRSINDQTYEQYWSNAAYEYLDWDDKFQSVLHGNLIEGDVTWFAGGKLNLCYNAIDRHVYKHHKGDKMAIIWEGDEVSQQRYITYNQLLHKVSQISNALIANGVKKGDVVTIYMPMIPELPMTMLACARIGAIHSVVFAGFSSEALSQRIIASSSKYLITSDIGKRGSKIIPILDIVNQARQLHNTDSILEKVFIWEHGLYGKSHYSDNESTTSSIVLSSSKDILMDDLVHRQRPYCQPVSMDSEDNLFILYTSGSTGQPKGVVHTTGGYGLWAAFTTRQTFDLQSDDDIFACVADCGWITGHTYTVYGPLLNGCTTFLFESTPLYPNAGRYWDMIERHGITQFYTAPTAIRSLMRYGDTIPKEYNLSSLKILGSVGEPINPEAWRWYYEVIGNEQCTIVDTYWQTETGGHIITNLPGITPMKPGSCTLPMYGIDPVIVDPVTGEIIEQILDEETGEYNEIKGVLVIRRPWPGMARTCLGDHERYMSVYLRPYPGYYFTGDACRKDKNGYHVIIGRVDDVLNVSGHRIGTAEVESALVAHPAVAQAAVIGKSHPIKGEAIIGFVTLQKEYEERILHPSNTKNKKDDYDKLLKELKNQVRQEIGPFASPDEIYMTDSMPMTRSGKIMRRILRKIISNEMDTIGDTSTLADPAVCDKLIEQVHGPPVVAATATQEESSTTVVTK